MTFHHFENETGFASGPRDLIVIKRIFITLINALRESPVPRRIRGRSHSSVDFAKVANEIVSFKINVLIRA